MCRVTFITPDHTGLLTCPHHCLLLHGPKEYLRKLREEIVDEMTECVKLLDPGERGGRNPSACRHFICSILDV